MNVALDVSSPIHWASGDDCWKIIVFFEVDRKNALSGLEFSFLDWRLNNMAMQFVENSTHRARQCYERPVAVAPSKRKTPW